METRGTPVAGRGERAADPPVIYLAGYGRSGSTLAERILGQAPPFVNVGELIDLYRGVAGQDELCGCGRPFRICPFWRAVGERATEGWSGTHLRAIFRLQTLVARQRRLPELLLPVLRPALRSAVAEYGRHYAHLYRTIAAEAGARYVVDASKWPVQALALARGGVDVRIIHLIRDARGVAHSSSKHVVRPHAVSGSDPMSRRSPASTAVRWALCQAEVELLRARGLLVTRMAYDDFVADPKRALSNALCALGVEPDPDWFGHIDGRHVSLEATHGLSGNPSRFRAGAAELRRDDAWRREMSRFGRATVTALAFPALLAYGRLAHSSSMYRGDRRTAEINTSLPNQAPDGQWPRVSVVLPTRQRPELVRESIAAIMGQDYPGEIECIVVHDQEEPDQSLKELATDRHTVDVVANTRSPGLAGARNTGLALATGAFVASCDDDDTWHPTKLTKQIRRLRDEPDLLVVGSGIRLLLPRNKVVEWPGRSDRITASTLVRNRVKELHSSTLVMHRDAFAKAGGYDEALPHGYAEDYDWVLRAVRVGHIGVIREPLADIRKDVQSWFLQRAENTSSALECLLEKHPEIVRSRRGHARVLGQIAFARSSLGRRNEALRLAGLALVRWPVAPHAYLAVLQATTGVEPKVMLRAARIFRRGLS